MPLTNEQVIEAMVDHVRKYLQLDDMKETGSKKSLTFEGVNPDIHDKPVHFALEVITDLSQKWMNDENTYLSARYEEREKRRPLFYTVALFPKSNDRVPEDSRNYFRGPFFKKADLVRGMRPDIRGEEDYKWFDSRDAIDLSRLEWEQALPLSNQRIAYFDIQRRVIEVYKFWPLPKRLMIPPDGRKDDQDYIWGCFRSGQWPEEEDESGGAIAFKQTQEHMHHRIRRISNPYPHPEYEPANPQVIPGFFTLTRPVGAKYVNFVKDKQRFIEPAVKKAGPKPVQDDLADAVKAPSVLVPYQRRLPGF